jgi:hypothetical protein
LNPHFVLRLIATATATAAFGVVTWLAWEGRLGVVAAVVFVIACASFYAARRFMPAPSRARYDAAGKILLTVTGMIALLRHPIAVDAQTRVPVYEAVIDYVGQVDGTTFVVFALAAMAVKFAGVISSAYGWHLLLVGQGIRFPFWSQTFTAFLIGRFIGTVLPSTIGLDGYTLYEASHYSNQWSRAGTAKMLEKIIGITGLFVGMAITLPFGYAVIQDVTSQIGRPGAAPALALAIGMIATAIPAVVVTLLARPALLVRLAGAFGRILPAVAATPVANVERALHAYHGQLGLLLGVLLAKFLTHFTTATVYYFTALAIGVAGARFWPITFGSTIQILATLLSPTIAGEGAREAFQALLLSNQLGGVAQAVLSAALGFIAAEAATLWGGLFLYTRTPGRRPAYALVDGKQVDYAWLKGG